MSHLSDTCLRDTEKNRTWSVLFLTDPRWRSTGRGRRSVEAQGRLDLFDWRIFVTGGFARFDLPSTSRSTVEVGAMAVGKFDNRSQKSISKDKMESTQRKKQIFFMGIDVRLFTSSGQLFADDFTSKRSDAWKTKSQGTLYVFPAECSKIERPTLKNRTLPPAFTNRAGIHQPGGSRFGTVSYRSLIRTSVVFVR